LTDSLLKNPAILCLLPPQRSAILPTTAAKSERHAHAVRVLRYRECAALAGVSLRTWERMIAEGLAPPVVRPSPGRAGHLDVDFYPWLEQRRSPINAA
jgi:predicted DNA-binding transcriptional regulator AlpA